MKAMVHSRHRAARALFRLADVDCIIKNIGKAEQREDKAEALLRKFGLEA